jgi:hypothetical protein
MRSVPYRGSIDHTICSLSCKFWHRLSTVAVQLLPMSGQSLDRACRAGGTDFVCVLLVCHPQLPSVAFHVGPGWLLHRPHGEPRIALRYGTQWEADP